jgi:CDP-glucose 4,6-dehydratase
MENMGIEKLLRESYTGKKIFLTGHTGFKGSWLTALLSMLGATVKGYALEPDYEHGLFDFIKSRNFMESVIADIRDKDMLLKEIVSFQPDYIFHLAAQPLVRRSYKIPAETFEINVAGTANLLECAAKLNKQCAIVVITTDKVYENKESNILYKENDALGGYDPYSASKACTELVVSSFRNSFFNMSRYSEHHKSLASARAGNVIGGGDWSADRIVPDIIRSLQKEQPVQIRNPKSIRPWQHVLEPLSGYLLLGALLYNEPDSFNQAFNFGPKPDDHLTVQELVQQAIKIWGSGSWKDISDIHQPHEASLLQLDISKAEKKLHWTPKLTASEAIEWTVNWYKKPDDEKLNYSLEQINRFFEL